MTERTLGMDISKYQKRVDFNKAKAAGAYFVFMKASQCLYLDPFFVVNWENANKAGVLRGVYHYLDFKNKPRINLPTNGRSTRRSSIGES
jgi:lysozyme